MGKGGGGSAFMWSFQFFSQILGTTSLNDIHLITLKANIKIKMILNIYFRPGTLLFFLFHVANRMETMTKRAPKAAEPPVE